MMKIAHLILAHNNPAQLARLIDRLTHPDAEIYIHLDGKTDIGPFLYLQKLPNVYFIKNRTQIYWGSYSIVKATLICFGEILDSGKTYGHINLLSGSDYPIKNSSQVHQFLSDHSKNIFIEYVTEDSDWWQKIKTRVTKYHLTDFHFPGAYQAQVLLNLLLPRRKVPKSLAFVGRSQWITITPDSARYVIDFMKTHRNIRRFFRFSWGSDEIAIQTILYNSRFKDQIVNHNYRYIDWSEGKASPKTLNMDDADKLLTSNCLYARKFDLDSEPEIFNYLDSTF